MPDPAKPTKPGNTWQCPGCAFSAVDAGMLREHRRRVHDWVPHPGRIRGSKNRPRNYPVICCSVPGCSYSVRGTGWLERHMRIEHP